MHQTVKDEVSKAGQGSSHSTVQEEIIGVWESRLAWATAKSPVSTEQLVITTVLAVSVHIVVSYTAVDYSMLSCPFSQVDIQEMSGTLNHKTVPS